MKDDTINKRYQEQKEVLQRNNDLYNEFIKYNKLSPNANSLLVIVGWYNHHKDNIQNNSTLSQEAVQYLLGELQKCIIQINEMAEALDD